MSSSSNSKSGGSNPESTYQLCKSYGGYYGFMQSHGLKPWDDDDVSEGEAILAAFRSADREARGGGAARSGNGGGGKGSGGKGSGGGRGASGTSARNTSRK